MIIGQTVNRVETEGFESQPCQIERNPMMYKILTESLYSNRLLAAFREIACNALDAHVEAGKPDVPITIVFPTSLSPVLVIQDEGPGMSKSDVFHLYTTLFASSKRNGNDQIGGFGLGSKSPHAYVDSFTLVSRHGTTESTYAIFKGPDGAPRVGELECRSYVGPTGCSVQIPIKPEDHRTLEKLAQSLLPFFPVMPKTNLDIKPIKYLLNTKTYAIRKPDYENPHSIIQVGPVPYPYDPNIYTHYEGGPSYRDVYGLNSAPFVFFAPIGSVEIAPSREALSFNEQTKENVNALVANALTSVTSDIADAISEYETPWGKLLAYAEFTSAVNQLPGVDIAKSQGHLMTALISALANPIGFAIRFPTVVTIKRSRRKFVELRKAHNQVTLDNLKNLKFYLVTEPMGDIERQLNLPDQLQLSSNYALIFINPDEPQNTSLQALFEVLEGAELNDWADTLALDLTPLPAKGANGRRPNSTQHPKTKRVYYGITARGAQVPVTDDVKEFYAHMMTASYAVYSFGAKKFFDPECTQPVGDLSTYIQRYNIVARHIGAGKIEVVLVIPRQFAHKPSTAQRIDNIPALVQRCIDNPQYLDLWELRHAVSKETELSRVISHLIQRTYVDLMADMTAALGQNPLMDTWDKHKDRLSDLFAFNRGIDEAIISIDPAIAQLPFPTTETSRVINDLQDIAETYPDLFPVSGYQYHHTSFEYRKHYLTLVHAEIQRNQPTQEI